MGKGVLAQTLIINEVSNGPTGSQEYVEFVVVDNTVSYDCTGSAPPCIDIRGWIFDDNSGFHGTSGTASGAVRFSQNALWSCVPLGTIILLYNGMDPNVSLPNDDFSLSDGNCSLVIALDNLTYFEFTETTPGDVACSYPSSGWGTDPSPTWSNVALANGGDCARIVDLNGCEVFSLCYGSCNQNTQIYFSGSGSDDVWFFNDGDPALQINWSEGCAGDIAACGSNDQTPGAPNNAANQAYIGQFNNNCSPITPLSNAGQTVSLSCGCNNEAQMSASGSIGPYTFEWLDNNLQPIGQNTATATGLCGGTYYGVATSHIGCTDTVQVVIANANSVDAGGDVSLSYCDLPATINLLDSLSGNPDPGGSWFGPANLTNGDQGTFDPLVHPNGTYYYVLLGGGGCPNDTAFVDIQNDFSPNAGSGKTIDLCSSMPSFELQDSIQGSFDLGGFWEGPSILGGGALGQFNPSGNLPGSYTYIVLASGLCVNDTAFFEVNTDAAVNAGLDGSITVCDADPTFDLFNQLNGTPQSGGQWQPLPVSLSSIFDPAVDASGIYDYIISGQGACPNDTAEVDVVVNPGPQVQTVPVHVTCFGGANGEIDLSAQPSSSVITWTLPGGTQLVQEDLSGLTAGSYDYEVSSGGACIVTGTVVISEPPALNLSAQVIDESCPDACDGEVTASVQNGSNPFFYTFNSQNTGGSVASALCDGTVAIEVTDNDGCTESLNVTVQTTGAAVSPQISGPAVICTNDGLVSYSADINGGTWSGTGVNSAGDVDPGSINTPTVEVIYTITSGCGGADTMMIAIAEPSPINIEISDTAGCAPLVVSFQNLLATSDNVSCLWTFSDGEQISECGFPQRIFTNEGCYGVSLEVTNASGCISQENLGVQICVEGSPDASFDLNDIAFDDLNTGLLAVPEDDSYQMYSWYFNQDLVSLNSELEIDLTGTMGGSYDICLAVTDAQGCRDSTCEEIVFKESIGFYIPNSFSPNGDGFNDVFRPVFYGNSLDSYEMIIVNRWGQIFFRSADVWNTSWDGQHLGQQVVEDTYIWKITYKIEGDPSTYEQLGHVNVIR